LNNKLILLTGIFDFLIETFNFNPFLFLRFGYLTLIDLTVLYETPLYLWLFLKISKFLEVFLAE
jgi:hypothetical protein